MTILEHKPAPHEATRNACNLCSPLGASIVFRGIADCVPFLHGGQGCATYIRRYCISHFREPVDIASSSFGEEATVFGGKPNLFKGMANVISQYKPALIGVASTCLAETIGEDVSSYLKEFAREGHAGDTELVFASTPSYSGSHYDGYHTAVLALVKSLAARVRPNQQINVLPNMISAADIRHVKQVCADFGIEAVVLPDYSDTLDGVSWDEYKRKPEGGTPLEGIKGMGGAKASIDFTRCLEKDLSSAVYLENAFDVPAHRTGLPVGVRATDDFMLLLSKYSGRSIPESYLKERGRLLDSYADAHKYVFGKRALVYGDPDFVFGLGRFLAEIGMTPILCSAGKKRELKEASESFMKDIEGGAVYEQMDFVDIEEVAEELQPDIFIGSSKGYRISRSLGVPLVRLGFPIHDRIGSSRLRCFGYQGTQELFDRIVNSMLENRQEESEIGYSYM